MSESPEEKATRLATELKTLIRCFEHCSFTSHIAHMANIYVRRGQVALRSPVRQLMYLISLYHATDLTGTEIYIPGSEKDKKMIALLNEIEEGYGYKARSSNTDNLSEDAFAKLLVTKSTFLNYYLNAPLTYYEQDIERVERTFRHFEPYIIQETGLAICDFIEFFTVLSKLEIDRGTKYLNNDFDSDPVLESIKAGKKIKDLTLEDNVHLKEVGSKAVYEMAIPITHIYEIMGKEKAEKLLLYFTLMRKENPEYLYYTDPCSYLRDPIIIMDGLRIAMIFSKQLINAIYEFLYELCGEASTPGKKVSERRDQFLEDKTAELFQDFFGSQARIFQSYYLNGNEKDLIVLQDRNVFIVECKAHKYRVPLRDQDKAYDRIRDDFKNP